MFRKFWLDVILATLFIFGLMGLFASATAFKIFDVFDPIGEAFGDMEVTDIRFSRLIDDPIADDRIVLVNIGSLSRPEIAFMLEKISSQKPAVIGIDSFFDAPKEDTLGDMYLAETLANIENLVMVSKVYYNEEVDAFDSVHYSWPMFSQFAAPAAANLITDAGVQEDLKMCREFVPKYAVNGGDDQIAFGVKLASYLDSAAARRYLDRNNEVEVINYRGNTIDYGATKFGNKFYALDVQDVFMDNYVPEMIEGKIVIFCYLGNYLGDRESFEDKFFTPLNETYIGRAYPDMYGGVIHANIASMVLTGDNIDVMSDNMAIFLGIFICFLNVALFSLVYKRVPKWYDGITKLFQMIELGGLLFLMIYVLDVSLYKMELSLALFAVALAGDALEVYYGVVKNSLTKEGRRSLFKLDKL